MDWRIKAIFQNIIAMFPENVSNSVYYRMQRFCGGLKHVNPLEWVNAAAEFSEKLTSVSHGINGKTIFEVGTGRRINFPLACWLMGAAKVTTIDKNRYLKNELIEQDINYLRANRSQIESLLGDALRKDRYDELVSFTDKSWSVADLMIFCNIDYISPGDATSVPVDSGSYDIHTSFNVLEHIPPVVLDGIFKEGKRILNENGIFAHRIDYSDHFSHSDKSISSINFLKFYDSHWNMLAGNRYMYMNRLRVDDVSKLFVDCGLQHLLLEPMTDPAALRLLQSGEIRLAKEFINKPHEVLATSSSWHIMKKLGCVLFAMLAEVAIPGSFIALQEV